MANTTIAVFGDRDQAERAVAALRENGFDREISVVAKEGREINVGGNVDVDTVSDGATTGGVLGGLAGLAAGAGALAIPGIGPLVAMGPIAGLLSGAAAGGLAGGLIDWGVPEQESREYEEDVKQGKILVSVRSERPKVDEAASILRSYAAEDVKVH